MKKPNCEKCKSKPCIKKGTPCRKVEKWLQKEGIKSSDWIRPKMPSRKRKNKNVWRELPFSKVWEPRKGHI